MRRLFVKKLCESSQEPEARNQKAEDRIWNTEIQMVV